MTNEFSKWYLAFLRKQVDEEIQFLITNGHDTDNVQVPCVFCTERQNGYYRCYRLNELRRFQSQIVQHQSTKSRSESKNIPKGRRPIGFDQNPVYQGDKQVINLNPDIDFSRMPLLSKPI